MHADRWTGPLVIAELVRAFKSVKGYGIALYSPSKNRLEPIEDAALAGLRLIERTAECLGREASHKLLAYARARAQRDVSELCNANGWRRRTLYYARDRAAAAVAACLNDAYRMELLDHCTIAGAILCPKRGQTLEINEEKDARPA